MDKENQEKTNKSLENEKDTKESLKETETNTEKLNTNKLTIILKKYLFMGV